MAVVAVTDSNNRLTDCDATTGFASDGGGGAGPQNEPDLGYQLTSGSDLSVSRKVGTTKGGHGYTHGSFIDMTAEANLVWLVKAVWYNSINAAAYPACGLKIGNSNSVFFEYAVIDDGAQGDLDADPKRLVYLIAIDPNVAAWPDIIAGTPNIAQIDFYGIQGDFGGSAKAENVAIDAIDIARGIGVLWLVGGDSTDPDGTIADFVAYDEGDETKRIGHIATVRPDVFSVLGTLWIGRTETPTATATVFQDSGKELLFPQSFFGAGWTGIGVDLGSATTDIDLVDYTLRGQGWDNKKIYFDTIDEIDPTPDEVTLSPATGFITGTPVVYSNEGGSDTLGLTSGNTYWLRRITDTTFQVHTTRDDSRTNTSPIALSDGSTGEAHSFQRTPDTRPHLTGVGTSGAFDALRTAFSRFAFIETTSAMTFLSCLFPGCGLIDLTTNNGGVFDTCIFTGQTTEPGEALVKAHSLVDLDDNEFTLAAGETGHAIEIDTAGTYTFIGNVFAGYWASPNNGLGAEFDANGGVDAGTDVITTDGNHGFADGDEVYYNDNGGTSVGGLTDGNRYYVNVITTTTFSLHRSKHNAIADTNRIGLTAGSTEQHTFYSGKAGIVNTSGGLVTINVSGGGTAVSVRNVGNVATAAVNVTFTLTLSGLQTGTEVRIFRQSDNVELTGVESSTDTFTYDHDGTSTDIRVIIQKIGFVWKQLEETLTNDDQSLQANQRIDRNYLNA